MSRHTMSSMQNNHSSALPHRILGGAGSPRQKESGAGDDQMFSFLSEHNAKYGKSEGSGEIAGSSFKPSGNANGTTMNHGSNYSISKGLDQHAASDFRDTVLFLVHQQSQRHNDLVGLVRELATDVSNLRGDIQHAQKVNNAAEGASPNEASSSTPWNDRQSYHQTHQSGAGSTLLPPDLPTVGFGGSYASTQQQWVERYTAQTKPMAYQREEELHAARKRIESLELQVEQLKLHIKKKDETIRRLTDTNVATLLSSHSMINNGIAAATQHQQISCGNASPVGNSGGIAAACSATPPTSPYRQQLGAVTSNAALRANTLSSAAKASPTTAALLKAKAGSVSCGAGVGGL